jgi:MraZ protein
VLLTGTHHCTLDDKQQLTLPKAVREHLGEPEMLFFTPGPDQCLWLRSPADLAQITEPGDRSAADEALVRAFRRLYFAQAEKSTVDRGGQCRVPERMAQFAGLRQEVVLIGVGDHYELWDAQRWQQYVQQINAAPAGSKRPAASAPSPGPQQ